jgi:hypothetical protein
LAEGIEVEGQFRVIRHTPGWPLEKHNPIRKGHYFGSMVSNGSALNRADLGYQLAQPMFSSYLALSGSSKSQHLKGGLEMIRRSWMAAIIFCLIAGFGIAAPQKSAVDGRWEGTLGTADGALTMTYSFKTKGQVLTGTEESRIVSRSISEGKVNGDKISFKTTVNGNTIDHQGTVSGDTIELKSYGPGGEFDVTLKRVSTEKKSAQQ